MMNEEERKKIFWLLKKHSSYSAWKSLAEAWEVFVKNWKFALQHANFTDPTIEKGHTDSYKLFLDGLIAFNKGLSLLKWGQKNVFSATTAGYFLQTVSPMRYARRRVNPDEYIFDWAINKEEIFQALDRVKKRRNDVIGVLENPDPNATASFSSSDVFWGVDYIPNNLSDVPPQKDIVTFTGKEVPKDGIWEPEWRTLLEVSRSSEGLPISIDKGCMNYLIAGSRAPYYQDAPDQKPLKVTWRLIWEDTRYRDGKIPTEEKEYLRTGSKTIHE